MNISTPDLSENIEKIETIVLRFRDLVIVEGETIKSHVDISKSAGFVWWGWWAKPNEKVPSHSFERLKNIANSKEWKIFLFHSGTRAFYEASCSDIVFDPNGEKIPTPDHNNTPEYYNESVYSAWFKLIKLNSKPLNADHIVRKYSYIHVSEAFSENDDSFSLFDNQIISSEDELIHQNRTIWFIKNAPIPDEPTAKPAEKPALKETRLSQATLDQTVDELKESIKPFLAYLPEAIGKQLEQKTQQVEHLTAKIIFPPEEQMEVRLTPLHILERYKQDSSDLTYIHILLGATIGTILGFITSIAVSKDFEWSSPIIIILGLLVIITGVLSYFCYVVESRRDKVWAKIQKKGR